MAETKELLTASSEYVALMLMDRIRMSATVKITEATGILDLYAECLEATTYRRSPPEGARAWYEYRRK